MPPEKIENPAARKPWAADRWLSLARESRHFLVLGCLLLALIWGTVYQEARRVRQDGLESFRTNLSHLADVMEIALARQLDTLDSALMVLRHVQLENPSEVPHMIEVLRAGPLRGQNVHVAVIGANGHFRAGSPGRSVAATRLSRHPSFRLFADGAPDQLLLSGTETPPWGPLAGLQLVRPILDPREHFQGIVLMVLPPTDITRFVHELDAGASTVLAVASKHGVVLSRSQDPLQHMGTLLPDSSMDEYRRHASGFAIRESALDRSERGLAHRWLGDYPVLLVASSATGPTMAAIRSGQTRATSWGALASAMVLLTLGFISRTTLRNRATEALRKREHEHLRVAQRVARLGSWELDRRSARVYWSDEVYRIFGQDPAQHSPTCETILQAVHPEDRVQMERLYAQSLAGRTPCEIEHRLLLDEGRVKWVREHCEHEFDDNGDPLRSYGTVQDITELKQQEAEREALLRDRLLLLESTGEGIFGIDINGRCTFINQAACRMLGYEAHEVVGRNLHKLMHYQHADGRPYAANECPIFHTYHTGHASRTPSDVFWRKDGSSLPVEYSAYPIRDAGRVTGTVTVFSDISERLRAEAEMRIAATAFESQEGMFVTDENGIVLRINSAFTQITGYTAQDIVGKNPKWRSSGRHDAAFYAALWARIRATGAWKGEIWNRRKNGEIYPESITITAVRGAGNAITNYVATLHDISERKAAEEHIHSLAFHDTLTQLPNRRLLQDRLQQAILSTVRSGQHGALLFIDLDKFKQLNDTLGHDAGDLLLQQVAQRLQQCVRQTDTVARLGGDEFVLLIEALNPDVAEASQEVHILGRKILEDLNRPYNLKGHVHHSTPSIGATLFSGHAHSGDELLRQADLAMYQAKAGGRNALSFFDAAMLEGHGSRFAGLT